MIFGYWGRTFLMSAARVGNINRVRSLIQNYSANSHFLGRLQNSAMTEAVSNKHMDVQMVLNQHGSFKFNKLEGETAFVLDRPQSGETHVFSISIPPSHAISHAANSSCAIGADVLLVSASFYGNSIRLWNASTGECRQILQGHKDFVFELFDLKDGRLVSGSKDCTLRIWHLSSGECQHVLLGHTGPVLSIAGCSSVGSQSVAPLSHGERSACWTRIASASADGTVRVWSTHSGLCDAILSGERPEVAVYEIRYSALHNRIVSNSDDGMLAVWDPDAAAPAAVDDESHQSHQSPLRGLGALSPSVDENETPLQLNIFRGFGSHVSSSSTAPTQPLPVGFLTGHTGNIWSMAILFDGHVVTASQDKTLRIWNLLSCTCERVLEGHTGEICCVYALPGGFVLSGSEDSTIRVWDAANGTCLKILTGHTGSISEIGILPDVRIASGSDDGSIRIWNVESGECELILLGHDKEVWCVSPLSDGQLATASYDGSLRIWR